MVYIVEKKKKKSEHKRRERERKGVSRVCFGTGKQGRDTGLRDAGGEDCDCVHNTVYGGYISI